MPALDAIALDLDGTLLEPGGTILADTLDTLVRAAAQGVRILLSTGRPPKDIAALTRQTGLDRLGLPHAAVSNERDLLLHADGVWSEVQPRNGQRLAAEYALSLDLRPRLEALHDQLAAIDPNYTVWHPDLTRERGFVELHFPGVDLAVQAAELVQRQMLATHPARPHIIANRRIFALRHPESGKGPSLAELCRLLDLAPARVLAIGDAENDRSMLDRVHGFIPGAPANAEPAIAELVRQGGGHVATLPRGAGVAEAVRAALA